MTIRVKQFMIKALSDNGEPSSKRVIGVFGLFLIHILITYASIKYGVTDNIESVIITLVLMDGSLLGITTIANAIK